MADAIGRIGSENVQKPSFWEVQQIKKKDEFQGLTPGAYMACNCNDIGNYLNGTKAYNT